jgi:hypothetical protein
MSRHALWQDEYWLLLMQLYLKKPEGVKPLYSKAMVRLALELHIPPQFLYEQMFKLRQLDTPRMEKLWERYGQNPKRLAKGVRMLRQMKGFNSADAFYEGVETIESWELDFKSMPEDKNIRPVMLIMILDLYFRLTPNTMVAETPEIQELGRLIKMKSVDIVKIMDIFQICDPYLNRSEIILTPLMAPCQQIWQRFGNDSPEKLAALAAQLKEYFKGER